MTTRPGRAPIPPVFRRLSRWLYLPLVFVVAAPIVNQVPALRDAMGRPTPWVWYGIPAACASVLALMFFALWCGRRRIGAALRAASGRACTHCTHDLTGLSEIGLCPECGGPFDLIADRRSWARVSMLT